jgi:hypothetical protein
LETTYNCVGHLARGACCLAKAAVQWAVSQLPPMRGSCLRLPIDSDSHYLLDSVDWLWIVGKPLPAVLPGSYTICLGSGHALFPEMG